MATRAGSPPDLDLARIRRFAQKRLPASVASEVRLEVEVEGANVTIELSPTRVIDRLLAELDADPYAVFWG